MMRNTHITCGDWEALIDVAHGANCIALRNKRYNAKLLREPPEDGVLDNPYLYGMPILFPVNRIEGGRFEFEERTYEFPINEPSTGCHLHGELHRMPFEILDQHPQKIACRYRAKRGEYLNFPHSFEIVQEYELKQDGFYHTVTVKNLSEQNMPLFLGFHTTFYTLFTNESHIGDVRVFSDITQEYERNMKKNYLPTGATPAFDHISRALSEGTYDPFSGPASRHYKGAGKMTITDEKRRLRLIYENDKKYTFRLIYNGGKEGYICLEPQTCLANCPNAPFSRKESGFDFLKVGESKTYISKICLEDYQP